MGEAMICVCAIGAPHGVRGNIRIASFTANAEDFLSYGPLSDKNGARRYDLEIVGRSRGQLIARIAGIDDRDAAEALKGTRLYVPRSALPQTDPEEFYHADLIGLTAVDPDGREVGKVKAVYDFGAGHVLEVVDSDRRQVLVPFTREAVPEIDIGGGRVVIKPPPEGDTAVDEES
ncbi:MAG: ribosome maturation factor RimM [Alphaproteobacteria bacterium]|nr:ribosome maturation factor RimM [Alphaproteobacteria bacterium]